MGFSGSKGNTSVMSFDEQDKRRPGALELLVGTGLAGWIMSQEHNFLTLLQQYSFALRGDGQTYTSCVLLPESSL